MRVVSAGSRQWIDRGGGSTVLFIDEIHRFNKSQQDALLPQVEDGTVTLIGATTENPYFEVNSALLSRLRVFRLESLSDADLGPHRPCPDDERGLAGRWSWPTTPASTSSHQWRRRPSCAQRARWRRRRSMEEATARSRTSRQPRSNACCPMTGLATATMAPSARSSSRCVATTRCGAVLARDHGRGGGGPQFIARRLIISAREDVGNADPRALQVAVAAAQALDWVGLPEAQYALAQATAYIAAAPKSNRAGQAYWAADGGCPEAWVAAGAGPSAPHDRARDASPRHGMGYAYPHDYEGADVEQQYLPDLLAERRYYAPSEHGYEKVIGERMAARRAARQQAAEGGGAQRDRSARPKADAMKVAGNVMARREERKRSVAAREKREAAGDES